MTDDSLTVTTWNINSVRLRIDLVRKFIKKWRPDILCLQEIKCATDSFPAKALHRLGYVHQAIHGQKGYHGVAIVSLRPFEKVDSRQLCGTQEARHISVDVRFSGRPLSLHNFYVPAGGDEPDPKTNPKFAHKLAFIEEMRSWFSGIASGPSSMLVGDLNIAPLENDVWSHKQLLKVVSHTPVETDGLNNLQAAGPWIDAIRHFVPADEKLFTWWSYRSPNWEHSDKGRRLDHIWVTPDLQKNLEEIQILRQVRGWQRPSDHAPIIARIIAR